MFGPVGNMIDRKVYILIQWVVAHFPIHGRVLLSQLLHSVSMLCTQSWRTWSTWRTSRTRPKACWRFPYQMNMTYRTSRRQRKDWESVVIRVIFKGCFFSNEASEACILGLKGKEEEHGEWNTPYEIVLNHHYCIGTLLCAWSMLICWLV